MSIRSIGYNIAINLVRIVNANCYTRLSSPYLSRLLFSTNSQMNVQKITKFFSSLTYLVLVSALGVNRHSDKLSDIPRFCVDCSQIYQNVQLVRSVYSS